MKGSLAFGSFSRLGVVVALLIGLQFVWLASTAISPVSAAGGTLGPLQFSRGKTTDNLPTEFTNSYPPPVTQVWITFDYKDIQPGTRLSRIIRYDTADISFGDLTCCQSTSGRYATALTAAPTTVLPEGHYEVVIFLDGVQAAIGGFEIRSQGGSDATPGNGNDNNGNGNGNDNN